MIKAIHKTADALQSLSHALDCLTLHGLANEVRLVANRVDAAAYRKGAAAYRKGAR
jgi:hypothetical protein